MHNYDGGDSFPTVGLIDDSDTPDASHFDVAPTNLADRTRWLKNRIGSRYWTVNKQNRIINALPTTVIHTWTDTLVNNANNYTLMTLTTSGDGIALGDFVQFWVSGTVQEEAGSGDIYGEIGFSYLLAGSWTMSVNQFIYLPSSGTQVAAPFSMCGQFTVYPTLGDVTIALSGAMGIGGSALKIIGSMFAFCNVTRTP